MHGEMARTEAVGNFFSDGLFTSREDKSEPFKQSNLLYNMNVLSVKL